MEAAQVFAPAGLKLAATDPAFAKEAFISLDGIARDVLRSVRPPPAAAGDVPISVELRTGGVARASA
jgi:hypothetical protein